MVDPALEVQYSEDDGDTWVTAGHPFDMMPVHSSVVSNSGKALTVQCLPLPEVMHDEVSLPTGKIRVRFYLSARTGQAGSIVLDDLQIIARGNANKPHPGAIPGPTEPVSMIPAPKSASFPPRGFESRSQKSDRPDRDTPGLAFPSWLQPEFQFCSRSSQAIKSSRDVMSNRLSMRASSCSVFSCSSR